MNLFKQDILWKGLQSLILGALTPLAFSPFDIHVIAIITPALLIHIWLRSTPRVAGTCGYLFGIGLFGIGVSWLHISINLFGGVNFAGSVLLTFLFVAFISLFPALVGYLSMRLYDGRHPTLSLLLLVPTVWTLSEWIRSWILTGFPWLNLGYSQTDSLLRGIAPLSGVFAISFAVVLTATALLVIIRGNRLNQYGMTILVILLWSGSWGSSKLQWTTPNGEEITVALIQGAVPQEIKWAPEMQQVTMARYMDLSRPYLDHDLIIWPEAAIPAFYDQIEHYIHELLLLTRENNNYLITGLPVRDQASGKYYNSIVMLDHDVSFYHKRHLVPFGEYLPLNFLLRPVVDYFGIPVSDFSKGNAPAPVISTRNFDIGVSICYEGTFGEEVIQALPEAAILINVSNDAWFGDSAAPHQHMQMSRMRALETGRYLLRSTNTGITGIIDHKGRVLAQLPQFKPMSLSGTAILFEGITPYARFGNYPVILLCLFIFTGFAYRQVASRN